MRRLRKARRLLRLRVHCGGRDIGFLPVRAVTVFQESRCAGANSDSYGAIKARYEAASRTVRALRDIEE
jgi:hypothetical protein